MSMRPFGDPLPALDERTISAILGELRAEIAYPVNLSRVLYNLPEGERKAFRRVLRKAREAREQPREEAAEVFGRKGKL